MALIFYVDLETLLVSTHTFAELGNRARPNYHDIQRCFKKCDIDMLSLEQYSEQYKTTSRGKWKTARHLPLFLTAIWYILDRQARSTLGTIQRNDDWNDTRLFSLWRRRWRWRRWWRKGCGRRYTPWRRHLCTLLSTKVPQQTLL